MSFSFSPKLRLAVLWPALAALLVVTGLLARFLPGAIEASAAADLVGTCRILASAEGDRLAALAGDPAAAEAWAARVTEGGAPELLQRLAYTYIGPGVVFPPFPNAPAGWVTHITVERIGGSEAPRRHA